MPAQRRIIIIEIHRMIIESWFTFWLLNEWCYNQVQKLVLSRHLLTFSLRICGLILFSDLKNNFLLKNVINNTQITDTLILASNSIFYNLFQNFRLSLGFII